MLRFGWWLLACTLFIQISGTPTTQAQALDLSTLTLEQKVGQLFVMSFFGETLNAPAAAFVTRYQPGAFVLLPSNLNHPEQITRLTNELQRTLQAQNAPPALIAVDQEGGLIAHLKEGFTTWPVPSLLTATQNPELAYQFGAALAQELRAVGINMNLAPVADLQTNDNNPIIGRRAFGSDPHMVAPIVHSVIRGMQDQGVLATTKHFPGHGATATDSHLELPVLTFSQNDLFARELIPFQAAIAADTAAIMVAHIHYPLIDRDRQPASLSQNIIQSLLRDQLAYDGLVITDALDMDAIDTVYSPADAALNALLAGNDLILLGAHVSFENQALAIQAIIDAVRIGVIPESRIDQSVTRILRAKAAYDLLNWTPLDPETASQRIGQSEHVSLVPTMFEQGITVVYDNNGHIPLQDNTLMIYPATYPRLKTACSSAAWQTLAVSLYPTDTEIAWAQRAARDADHIVVMTENVAQNPQQALLVTALPSDQTVVVASWSPYDLYHLPPISTYLVTYSPLPESYQPLCSILQGNSPAIGQLSLSLNLSD